MSAVLGGAVAVDGRVPAAGELLDRAHVDHAVVQVFHQAGHVPVEELLVGAHGVASEQRLDAFRGELLHVLDHTAFGLSHVKAVGPFVDESGTGVHGAHEVVHMRHGRVGRFNHEVDALVEHIEFEIGRHHGDLAQLVVEDVEPGHLAVDPDEP